jgi:hypothetical protein
MMAHAQAMDYDVFNMVDVLANKSLVTEDAGMLFKIGGGRLSHYLYNWRCPAIEHDDIGIVLV